MLLKVGIVMSYEEIINDNIKAEFDAFKSGQLLKPQISIFENAGKIHFYKEIFGYISGNTLSDIFNQKELKKLSECRKLIGLLYEEYLSKEHLNIANWSAIHKLFNSFLN